MIQITKLNKIFHPNKAHAFSALKDISLSIEKNHFVIFKGVSGSGKSTLLSIIASLQKPSSGALFVDGEAISKLPDYHASHFRSAKIGFIPQSFNLLESLSVEENVSIALIPLGFSPKEIKKKTKTALSLAKIAHKQTEIVANLSGGEKQRAAIARALVNDANIILCDEPTANLDKENSKQFIEIMRSLKKKGKTIVIATHDPLFDNLDFCDRHFMMQDGEILDES